MQLLTRAGWLANPPAERYIFLLGMARISGFSMYCNRQYFEISVRPDICKYIRPDICKYIRYPAIYLARLSGRILDSVSGFFRISGEFDIRSIPSVSGIKVKV